MSEMWSIEFRDASLPGGVWRPAVPPIIQVASETKTVTTRVAGSSRAVTEIIASENYRIRMDGFVKSPPENGIESNIFPEAQLKILANMSQAKRAMEVVCEYLAIYGIRNLVLQSVSYNVAPGVPHEFRYTITAISDEAPEIQILRQ